MRSYTRSPWRAEFVADAAQVAQARHTVTDTLPDGYPRRDDVALVVGELAANAVEHSRSAARGTFVVELTVAAEHVQVAVRDGGADTVPRLAPAPDPLDPTLDAEVCERGRGLWLVAGHADAWGHEAENDGRVVWARFDKARAEVPSR